MPVAGDGHFLVFSLKKELSAVLLGRRNREEIR